ncbi:MAG: hypothetical protein AB7T49_05145 [Oligoflexales bacterium]
MKIFTVGGIFLSLAMSTQVLGSAQGINVNVNLSQNGQCVRNVEVNFAEPVNRATLMGSVILAGEENIRRALVLTEGDQTSSRFVFAAAHKSFCRVQGFEKVVVKRGIKMTSGKNLERDVSWPIWSNAFDAAPDSEQWTNMDPKGSCPGVGCLFTSLGKISSALYRIAAWQNSEKSNSIYKTGGLKLLPMGQTALEPYSPVNRKNHYGNNDTIFVLRKASKFLEFLYPERTPVRIADLSASDGNTPRTSSGTYTHPQGAHVKGQDVDISYVEMGDGSLDWEKNFWLVYSIIQSTGVDLVITAFKDQFIDMAEFAYQHGMINKIARARFNKLSYDTEMNHDKHLHVSIRNSVNNYKSRRFMLSDDVYSCYLALDPRYSGGDLNFCGDPS